MGINMPQSFRKVLIPAPGSRFVRVRCNQCGNEQIIFDHASIEVRCLVCGNLLARPTGGKAEILGTIVKVLE